MIVHSHVQLQPCLIAIGYIQCLTALTVCLADVFCLLHGLSMIDINNNNHDNSNRCGRHRHRYRYRHRYRHRPLHLHSAQFLIKFSDFVTWRTSFLSWHCALKSACGSCAGHFRMGGRQERAVHRRCTCLPCLFLKSNRPVSIFLDRKSFASLFGTVLPCDSGDVCLCRPSSRVCTRSSAYSTHVFGCTYLHPDLTVFQQQVFVGGQKHHTAHQ